MTSRYRLFTGFSIGIPYFNRLVMTSTDNATLSTPSRLLAYSAPAGRVCVRLCRRPPRLLCLLLQNRKEKELKIRRTQNAVFAINCRVALC